MNKVLFMGRLTKEPEIRYSTNSVAIARFTIAVNRREKKENENVADFIQCVALGKIGEFVEKYLKKGMKIALEGSWQTGNYTNKNGQKVYTNECLVNSIEFAESKKTDTETKNGDDYIKIPDGFEEDLPFS